MSFISGCVDERDFERGRDEAETAGPSQSSHTQTGRTGFAGSNATNAVPNQVKNPHSGYLFLI